MRFNRTQALLAALFLTVANTDAAPDTPADLFHTLQRDSWYFVTNDQSANIYVTSLGRGPKVVVLHGGWGANHEYMVRAVERHTAQREFVLFDQRGSLLSAYRGKLEDLSVDDLVDDLEKLRTELGEERLTLLAHSMGSMLAYEYLRAHPDRVASLILVGAFPPQSGNDNSSINTRGEAMMNRPEVEAVLKREGLDKVNAQSRAIDATHAWRARFAGVNMVRVENWRDMEGGRAYYNGEIGGRLASTNPKTWDVPAALGERRIPISVIQGDQDYVDPAAAGWAALKNKGGSLASCITVRPVARAGHSTWLDDPQGFEHALDEALRRKGC